MKKSILLVTYWSGILNRTKKYVYLVKDEEEVYLKAKDKNDDKVVCEDFYLPSFTEKDIKEIYKFLKEARK